MRLSTAAPRPGEVLTIAGYGRDSRIGPFPDVAPSIFRPAGTIRNETHGGWDVAARQGDSGGPIFNARGELAGVLFGSNDSFLAGRYTMGSYCGRVRLFVASVSGDFQRLPANPTMRCPAGPSGQRRPVPTGGHCDASEPPPPTPQIAGRGRRQIQTPAEVDT